MNPIQPSLLVVDDDQDTCHNLADIFSDLGYRVETALDAPTALARARNRWFDVALLDLMLPGMDGLDLYESLHTLCPATAAVLITGEPHHPRAAKCLQAGIKAVIPKPLNIPPLASMVAEFAGSSALGLN